MDLLDITSKFNSENDNWVREQERIQAIKALKEKKAKLLAYYQSEKSGVPKRFWNSSFDTYIPVDEIDNQRLKTVINFTKLKDNDKVLLLIGKFGNGKSHLGASIIRELGGIMVTSEDVIMNYESSLNFNSGTTKAQLMKQYTTTNMLVLDEIGRYSNSNKEQELLGYILRKRYDNKLPSCLISNLTKTQTINLFGAAITDRLNETGLTITFNKESYRSKIRDTKLQL